MSFIGFHPCPKCNSKDNLAEFKNGYHCFGCGYNKPKRNLSVFNEQKQVKVYNGIVLENSLDLDHLKWLSRYKLTNEEMQSFKTCKTREIKGTFYPCNLLILINEPNYWQGRNFSEGVKYLSSGEKPYIEHRGAIKPNVLVFTEDIISAKKVARVATSVAMLGARVQKDWWQHAKKYDRIIIWGDRDKATDNILQANQASLVLGKKVEVIITELDPKEYNNNNIINYIN